MYWINTREATYLQTQTLISGTSPISDSIEEPLCLLCSKNTEGPNFIDGQLAMSKATSNEQSLLRMNLDE